MIQSPYIKLPIRIPPFIKVPINPPFTLGSSSDLLTIGSPLSSSLHQGPHQSFSLHQCPHKSPLTSGSPSESTLTPPPHFKSPIHQGPNHSPPYRVPIRVSPYISVTIRVPLTSGSQSKPPYTLGSISEPPPLHQGPQHHLCLYQCPKQNLPYQSFEIADVDHEEILDKETLCVFTDTCKKVMLPVTKTSAISTVHLVVVGPIQLVLFCGVEDIS